MITIRVVKYKTSLLESGDVVLQKEYCVNAPGINRSMQSPENVREFAVDFLELNKMSEEYVFLLCLNSKMFLTSIFEISHGTVDCSVASPREVFQKALLANAVNLILVHNHPSGDPYPSKQDVAFTKRLKDASTLMGIDLIDHIIIGRNNYVSLREMGYIT